MKRVLALSGIMIFLLSSGCTGVYKVEFPPADKLFITSGDDPGSESPKPYTPKGNLTVVNKCGMIPIPLFSVIPVKRATPDDTFNELVIPEIKKMGGDALINARVEYISESWLLRIFLPWCFEQTIVSGTVVKRHQ